MDPRHLRAPTKGVRAGGPWGLVDALLWLWQRLAQGQELSLLTGADTIESLYSFTIGRVRNTVYNRQQDPALSAFWDWLRDVTKEFPGEGWHVKYLRDCNGNHARAIQKLLDLAAEFQALP